jgi:hypothetical protein
MPYREGRWRKTHGPHHRIEHKAHSHTCSCGKLAYRSKTEAKRAMREAQIRYAGRVRALGDLLVPDRPGRIPLRSSCPANCYGRR